MIRPEQILSRSTGAGGEPDGEGVRAKVIGHTYYGPDTVIRLALESDPATIVKTKTFAHDIPTAGELVELTVQGPVIVFPQRTPTRTPVLAGDERRPNQPRTRRGADESNTEM
jgi:hypothetical protein